MQTSLVSKAGYRWINCFRATRDGFNSYVLKSQCGHQSKSWLLEYILEVETSIGSYPGLGLPVVTMLIAKSTTSGYFFGAWSDVTYENRNMWGSSRYNWLWRYPDLEIKHKHTS